MQILTVTAALASVARAAPPAWRSPGCEPDVATLQRAAARLAEVHPERVHSLTRRAGRAGWLPSLRVRVSRDMGDMVRGSEGTATVDRYATTTSDDLRLEVEASWSLDRLIFDRNELWAAREALHHAVRREQLQAEVARLYYARRRLQLEAGSGRDPSCGSRATTTAGDSERDLALAELTAVLDALTGGALTTGSFKRADHP